MALLRYSGMCFLIALFPCVTNNLESLDPELSREDRWIHRMTKNDELEVDEPCARIHPNSRDMLKRFNSILPYFDKDHSNTAFLRKYRATVQGMSDADDPLDKEVAFYAAVLTPLIFLQNYKNTWCLLERFHRSLRLYQNSHPMEKRPALKLLQSFRSVNQKVNNIIKQLTPHTPPTRSTASDAEFGDLLSDNKDMRYIKEIIKNFG